MTDPRGELKSIIRPGRSTTRKPPTEAHSLPSPVLPIPRFLTPPQRRWEVIFFLMITQAQAKTKKKKKKGRSTRRLGCPIHRHLTRHIAHGPKRRKGSTRRRKKQAKRPKRIIRRKEASKTRRRDGRHPHLLPISHLLLSVWLLLAFPFPLTFSPMQHNHHNMLDDLFLPLLKSYLNSLSWLIDMLDAHDALCPHLALHDLHFGFF